uniref:FAR1 domain-containing protein n=1 Tax=Globisporangium ultimum (strain ATCC 200006 / CBS 805.95 / DAOM BR144) TaxID=431595 RepID=K3WY61_GLOUD
MFASWDTLEAYLREFMESAYQLFKVRNSIPIKTRNEALEARNAKGRKWTMLPEEWKYYQRIYACTHAAASHRRGRGVRNHALVRDMGCTAKIKATLQFTDARYFIAVLLEGFHNHPCDRERYFAYPENRRIKDPALQRLVLRLHDRGTSTQEIHACVAKRIKKATGTNADIIDIT